MPIEIRELIIKATVKDAGNNSEQRDSSRDSEIRDESLIAECVEQVLEILQKKKER